MAATRAPKKTARARKATRAKTSRSKPGPARLEADPPRSLHDCSRRVRGGLLRLEKRIEWQRRTLRGRRAIVGLLRRLEQALEPPRKARPRKEKAARARAGRAHGST